MAKTRRLERLNAADLYVLMWDDFGWSGDIGVLAILDGTRLVDHDGQLRIGMVRRHIQSRLHLVPRFRQLLYRPRLGLGWPVGRRASLRPLRPRPGPSACRYRRPGAAGASV
jgi:hypothetical protein